MAEIDKLFGAPLGGDASQPNAFAVLEDQRKKKEAARANAILSQREGFNPAAKAEAYDISDKAQTDLGADIPPSMIGPDNKASILQKLDDTKVQKMAAENPATATWLQNYDNAELAYDDLNTVGFWGGLGNSIASGGDSMIDGLVLGTEAAGERLLLRSIRDGDKSLKDLMNEELSVEGLGDLPMNPLENKLLNGVARFVGSRLLGLTGLSEDDVMKAMGETMAKVGSESKERQAAFGNKSVGATAVATLVGDIPEDASFTDSIGALLTIAKEDPAGFMSWGLQVSAESIPSIAAATAVTFLTKNPAAAAATLGVGSASRSYEGQFVEIARSKGFDITTPEGVKAMLADPASMEMFNDQALTYGAVVGVIDGLSGGIASRTMVGNAAGEFILQMATQAAMGSGGEFLGRMAAGLPINWTEIIIEGMLELVTGPLEIVGVGGRTAFGKARKVQDANDRKKVFKAIGVTGEGSKLKGRAAKKYQDLVDKMTKDGPIENVHVDPEKLEELFQTMGTNAEDFFSAAGMDISKFTEARNGGFDVQIPTSVYATHVVGTDLEALIGDHIKFNPLEMTVAEAQNLQSEIKASIDKIGETVETVQAEVGKLSERAQVEFESLTAQLRQAGRLPEVAAREALPFVKFLETRSARSGVPVDEIARRYGVPTVASRDTPSGPVTTRRVEIGPIFDEITSSEGSSSVDVAVVRAELDNAGITETPTEEEVRAAILAAAGKGYLSAELSDELVLQPQDIYRPAGDEMMQTATLRNGEETLEEFGHNPNVMTRTRDLALMLQARQRKLYGKIGRKQRGAATIKKMASWMADEIEFELQTPGKSAFGWYGEKFQRALDKLGDIFPELTDATAIRPNLPGMKAIKTTEDARALMTMFLAITSNGAKVVDNFRLATETYREFTTTGRVGSIVGASDRGASVKSSLNRAIQMINEFGSVSEVQAFLLEEMTVSDANKDLVAIGMKKISGMAADMIVPRAATLFGPKIGAFYANLSGSDGFLTMDLWWTRTINRYRGDVLPRVSGLKNAVDTKGKPVGLHRFKYLIGRPDLTDNQALNYATEYAKRYEDKSYKDGTEAEKAANTIYKAAFVKLAEQPAGPADRTFMVAVATAARDEMEARTGQKMTISDVQAIIWYYEKRLYADMGVRESGDISYEEAAERAVRLSKAPTQMEMFQDAPVTDRLPGIEAASPGRVPGVKELAAKYMKKAGLKVRQQANYVAVDKARATEVAQLYEDAVDSPNDPEVIAAYDALAKETLAQFEALQELGFTFSWTDETANDDGSGGLVGYATPADALRDMQENKHLSVFKTTKAGFGSDITKVPENHPLLQPTGIMIDGQEALVNDIFRIVHDVFGHGTEGAAFGARGEENAWQAHVRMFSPLAARAMTSETRGQNSWVNFGPKGEANRADPANTVFADQKSVLLPEWVSTVGQGADEVAPGTIMKKDEPLSLWHGTNQLFANFRDGLIFLSSRRGLAVDHALRAGGGGRVIETNVAVDNPLEVKADTDPDIYWLQNTTRLQDEMAAGGHDAIMITRGDEMLVIATSDSQITQITAPDPRVTLFQNDGLKLSDFDDMPFESFSQKGWFIVGATQSHLGASDSAGNVAASKSLRKDLEARNIPYRTLQGMYAGEPDGVTYLALGDEATAEELGQKYLQESILDHRGLVYTDGSIRPRVPFTGLVTGEEAAMREFHSIVLKDGKAFSLNLQFPRPLDTPYPEGTHYGIPLAPDGRLEMTHWSPVSLDVIDPKKAGTGPLHGAERKGGSGYKGSFFGLAVGQPGGYLRERTGPYKHTVFIDPNRLYPYYEDPNDLRAAIPPSKYGKRTSQQEAAEYERMIVKAGYDGYFVTSGPHGMAAKLAVATTPDSVEADSIFYQEQGKEMPLFKSQLAEEVANAKQKSASAKDWLAIVPKLPGVKDVEIFWSALDVWLESKDPKEQISREDLYNYLMANEMEIVTHVAAQSEGGDTRFLQYTEGGKPDDYLEIRMTLPKLTQYPINSGAAPFVNESHFEDENIVVHMRATLRGDTYFVEEVQSDLASGLRKSGGMPSIEKLREIRATKDSPSNYVLDKARVQAEAQDAGMTWDTAVDTSRRLTKAFNAQIREQMLNALNQVYELSRAGKLETVRGVNAEDQTYYFRKMIGEVNSFLASSHHTSNYTKMEIAGNGGGSIPVDFPSTLMSILLLGAAQITGSQVGTGLSVPNSQSTEWELNPKEQVIAALRAVTDIVFPRKTLEALDDVLFDQYVEALDAQQTMRKAEYAMEVADTAVAEFVYGTGAGWSMAGDVLPFTPFMDENAVHLALKFAIRDAAKRGFKRLGWTPAIRQGIRYNSAVGEVQHNVRNLRTNLMRTGKMRTLILMEDGSDFQIVHEPDTGEVIDVVNGTPRTFIGKNMDEIVGAGTYELLKTATLTDQVQVEGKDMVFTTVEGGGFITVYDRQIKKFLEKFGKKFGAKVSVADDVVEDRKAPRDFHRQINEAFFAEMGFPDPTDLTEHAAVDQFVANIVAAAEGKEGYHLLWGTYMYELDREKGGLEQELNVGTQTIKMAEHRLKERAEKMATLRKEILAEIKVLGIDTPIQGISAFATRTDKLGDLVVGFQQAQGDITHYGNKLERAKNVVASSSKELAAWPTVDAKRRSILVGLSPEKRLKLIKPENRPADMKVETWSIEITDSMREEAMKPFTLFQNQSDRGPRGSIILPPPGSGQAPQINLFERANLSTVLHEGGHYFLWVLQDMAKNGDASAQSEMTALTEWWMDNAEGVAEDGNVGVDVVRKFLRNGTTGDSDLDVKVNTGMHEQFARGFEAYALEGKAPSNVLRAAFESFSAWLLSIYSSITGLNVNLTPEVRAVFDRMLATDQELAEARVENNIDDEIARVAKEMGLDTASYAALVELTTQARDEAKQVALKEVMAPLFRMRAEEYREERELIEARVTNDVRAKRANRVIDWLGNQKWHGGGPVAEELQNAELRMDPALLDAEFEPGTASSLPRGSRPITLKGSGVSADDVAGWFGYRSGAEMIHDLQTAPKAAEEIKARVRAEMDEKYGDVMKDGTIEQVAVDALHGDKRGQLIVAELRAINRLGGRKGVMTSRAQATAIAEGMLRRMPAREAIQSGRFLAAERKYAEAATRALVKGDMEGAFEAKRRQLINHSLYSQSRKAAELVGKAERLAGRLRKRSTRKNLAGEYLAAIDEILDVYDFRQMSGVAETKRGGLLAYVEMMRQAGRENELAIPGHVLSQAKRVPYKTLSMQRLEGVFDALRNIEHTARLKKKLRDAVDARNMDEVVGELGEAFKLNIDGKPPKRVQTTFGRIADGAREYTNLILNADTILRRIDGWTNQGTAIRNLKNAVDDAEIKALNMRTKAALDFEELYSVYTKMERLNMAKMKVWDGHEEAYSKWDLISIALNTGNKDNFERLTSLDAKGAFTAEQVEALTDNLDVRDWHFVQSVWDYIDTYWAEIAERERRTTGIVPTKVTADIGVTNAPSFVKGGYYPIVYDGRHTVKVAEEQAMDLFTNMMQGRFGKAQTSAGHTKERAGGGGGRTVQLGMHILHGHVQQVIHDLAFSEPVNNVWKILQDPRVKAMFEDNNMISDHQSLEVWIQDVASGQLMTTGIIGRFARRAKSGFTLSKLAFNMGTVAIQITGVAQTMAVVGKKRTAVAYGKYAAGGFKPVANRIKERSAFMAERETTFNRDIYDLLNDTNSGPLAGTVADVRSTFMRLGFYAMQKVQFYSVDVPTWIAGYDQGISEGMDDASAAKHADRMVARAQASGLFADRSSIERGTLTAKSRQNDFIRLFTALGSYMFAKFNVATEVVGRTKNEMTGMNAASFTALMNGIVDMALLFTVEAILYNLIKGTLPGWGEDDDDEESWTWFLMRETMLSGLSTLPFLREMGSAAQGFSGGGAYSGVFETLAKPMMVWSDGKLNKQDLKKTIDAIGLAIPGVPSVALNRIIDAEDARREGDDVSPIHYIMGLPR